MQVAIGARSEQRVRIEGATIARRLPLAAILGLSAFLRLYDLQETGQNLFYAAATRSMLDSWHNFFFLSFDPGGSLAVDKPPLGLWLQAASARLLGFDYWVLALPQAIAGVVAIACLYAIAARWFSRRVALAAALLLAITPVSVASSRNNSFDTITMALMLLAAWATLRACDAPRAWRWSVLVAVFAALAVNTKGLAALVPAPALAAAYWVAVRQEWRRVVGRLAVAAAVFAVLGLAWVVAVAATPASARPVIYNGYGNNIWALTFRYNGLDRLTGHGPQERLRATGGYTDQPVPDPVAAATPPPRTPWRLFTGRMGSQLGWLLPAAAVGAVLVWRRRGLRRPADVLLVTWFATGLFLFTASKDFKPQYLEAFTAPVALLAAYAAAAAFRRGAPADLRVAVAVPTLAVAAMLFWVADETRPLSVVAGVAGAFVAVAYLAHRAGLGRGGPLFGRLVLAATALALVGAPLFWSVATAVDGQAGSAARYPIAGPASIRDFPPSPGGDAPPVDATRFADPTLALLAAEAPPGGYLVLTERALFGDAARYILETNRPVLTLDSFETAAEATASLQQLVASDRLRFLQLPSEGPWSDATNDLGRWFGQHCQDITVAAIRPLDGSHLYRCR